jgi:hypothetical protein
MADPVDMIVPLLREMRIDNVALHEQTHGLIKALDKRSGAVEGTQRMHPQSLTVDEQAADTVIL